MRKLFRTIRYISRKATASRISAYSAQTAYFMFMSLIPLVILLLSLLHQLGTSVDIVNVTSQFAPGFLSKFFEAYIDEIVDDSRLSLTIISAAVLLWTASKGVFAIIGGMNSVYEIKENRNYFLLRLLAMFYTISFIVLLIAVILVLLFGNKINDLLYSILPNLKGLVYIVSSLRFVISFLVLVIFFSLLYKSLPNSKMRFSDQIPGAVIASGGWVAFSLLFSFFVDNFSNYANIYGSLTTIIVLMLWLYICMYILFLGAEINKILSTKINEEQC